MKDYKIIMIALIALAVFIPFVASAAMDTTVVHSDKTGVDSKYNPNVGSKYDLSVAGSTYSGTAEVRIRSMSNLMNPTLVLVNNAMPDVNKTIDVAPTGVTDITELPVGTYTITLNRFDLPAEVATFKITAAQQQPTYVTFIGQAFSQPEVPKVTITQEPREGKICILGATYGAMWTTKDGKHITHGKYVDITHQLQTLVNGGDTSFQFDVATIDGLTKGDSAQVVGGDPDSGVVKNAIVIYSFNGHLHIKTVMEQDVGSYMPPTPGGGALPYIPVTMDTVLNLN